MLQITGRETNWAGTDTAFDFVGSFWHSQSDGIDVRLGQLRTDASRHWLVVPPEDVYNSPGGAGITSFADNDAWRDDWYDGPVTASVEIKGRVFDAEPLRVACVCPDFAPEIQPITTLCDVIQDMNVQEGCSEAPEKPLSFTTYIYPTLRRVALMQWVTQAANLRRGWMAIGDPGDPDYVARLADPDPANAEFRQQSFALFRDPNNLGDAAFVESALDGRDPDR